MRLEDYDPATGRSHVTIHTVFRCQANLSHIGETVGNQANLRETKCVDPAGRPATAFEYSGNAIRNGILRQYGMRSFFEAIGVTVPPKIHQTFFSGGALDGGSGNDIQFDHKIRTLCPLLSLLGAAKPTNTFGVKDALMIGGRSKIGPGMLVCWENGVAIAEAFSPALPLSVESDLLQLSDLYHQLSVERMQSRVEKRESRAIAIQAEIDALLRDRAAFIRSELRPYRQWLTRAMEYPRDSTQAPELAKYLSPAAPPSLLAGDAPPKKGKAPKKTNADGSKDTRNILEDWMLGRGAVLYSRWDFHCTPTEEGAIADAMLAFGRDPYLGGKNRTGNGLVSVDLYWESEGSGGEWLRLNAGVEQISDRAAANHARYRAYLDDYREHLADAAASDQLRTLLEAS